ATQKPSRVAGSTSQHIEPCSHVSMPLVGLPSPMHASPTASGSSATGEQRVEFQEPPPSVAHGMHFSPRGQSGSNRSHVGGDSVSGTSMNPTPVSLLDSSAGGSGMVVVVVVVVVPGGGGSVVVPGGGGLPLVLVPSSLEPPVPSSSWIVGPQPRARLSPQARPSRIDARIEGVEILRTLRSRVDEARMVVSRVEGSKSCSRQLTAADVLVARGSHALVVPGGRARRGTAARLVTLGRRAAARQLARHTDGDP